MNLIVKSVELPNRVTLPYVEQGDPSGVPVVLLHGVTDSWHSFELLMPHLPAALHVFALTRIVADDYSEALNPCRCRG